MSRLTEFLIEEQQAKRKGGIYHKTQVQPAYNSNRLEGSRLTEEQTRYIFETRTIGFRNQEAVPVDDIIETSNQQRLQNILLPNPSKILTSHLGTPMTRFCRRVDAPSSTRRSTLTDTIVAPRSIRR